MSDGPPTGLRRLWAPSGPAVRESRVGLNPHRIVQAAIELADGGGLDAVSMSRIAKRLGYTTMSLYRHVSNKDELLLLMHDEAWRVPETLDQPFDGWRDGLMRWCLEQRAILRRHLWLERIRVTERAGTPSQLTWMDRGLRTLADTPLSEHEKTQIMLLLNGNIFWDGRLAADLHEAQHASGQDLDQATAELSTMIKSIVDPARFPFLHRAVAAGIFDRPYGWETDDQSVDPDLAFAFGLNLVLDGVANLIAQRTTPTERGE